MQVTDIPADYQELAQEQQTLLLEALAEADEEVMERYLADEPVDAEMMRRALRRGTISSGPGAGAVRLGLQE